MADRTDDWNVLETVHPTQQNLPSAADDRYQVARQGKEGQDFIGLGDYPFRTIGKADGDPSELLLGIGDLVSERRGDVFVLDAGIFIYASLRVFIFNDRGALRTTLGGRGAGPGQFGDPRALDLSEDGRLLLVMDNRRTHVFQREGDVFQFMRAFQVPYGNDLCTMNEEAYTLGYSRERLAIIHRYAIDGTHIASFGEPYDDPNEPIRMVLSDEGLIACNAEHRIVGLAHTRIPVLTGYSEDGNVAWRVRFADFEPETATLASTFAQIRMTYHRLPGTSRFTSLVKDSPDHFLVQYTTRGDTSRAVPRRRHLFRVEAATGANDYLGWTDEEVLAVDSARVITDASEDFPQFRVYEAREALWQVSED